MVRVRRRSGYADCGAARNLGGGRDAGVGLPKRVTAWINPATGHVSCINLLGALVVGAAERSQNRNGSRNSRGQMDLVAELHAGA